MGADIAGAVPTAQQGQGRGAHHGVGHLIVDPERNFAAGPQANGRDAAFLGGELHFVVTGHEIDHAGGRVLVGYSQALEGDAAQAEFFKEGPVAFQTQAGLGGHGTGVGFVGPQIVMVQVAWVGFFRGKTRRSMNEIRLLVQRDLQGAVIGRADRHDVGAVTSHHQFTIGRPGVDRNSDPFHHQRMRGGFRVGIPE
ncbi:MAG: hypothetical protein WCI73_19210 [Phycisphaerae bacterium]